MTEHVEVEPHGHQLRGELGDHRIAATRAPDRAGARVTSSATTATTSAMATNSASTSRSSGGHQLRGELGDDRRAPGRVGHAGGEHERERARAHGSIRLAVEAATPIAFRTVNAELEHRVHQLTKIARADVPVLIRGETGTGKELVARAIHDVSARRGPFVPINCGALPRNLIESELFGHKRGAFSGANEERDGLVRSAHGGTLFLDEIADLPEESQATLLRVLYAPPAGWVTRARVRSAQRLLETTSLSVERVAADVGFGSSAVLREHFGQIVGTSPQGYRHAFRATG